MQIKIPITPVSLNKAHRGRHFKTPTYKKYEMDVFLVLPEYKGKVLEGELFLKYSFYIKNYGLSDTGNLEKLITDILVKRGYLKDDRYIKAMYLEKIKVKDVYAEKIVIDIVPYINRYKILNVF